MHRGNQSNEPTTASAVTRKFFEIIKERGLTEASISKKCGVHYNTLRHWRSGKCSATIISLEAALQTMGLELTIQPITKTKASNEVRS